MLKLEKDHRTFLYSLVILGTSFYWLQYIHQAIKAGTCSLYEVKSYIYWEPWGWNARCRPEMTNWDFMELSGGVTLGIMAIFFFLLSFSKRWKTGMIASVSIASYQFFAAYVSNQMGYMYTQFQPWVVPLAFACVASMVFVISVKVVTESNFNKKISWVIPAIALVIVGVFALSLVLGYITQPNDATPWIATALGLSGVVIWDFIKKLQVKRTPDLIHNRSPNYIQIFPNFSRF